MKLSEIFSKILKDNALLLKRDFLSNHHRTSAENEHKLLAALRLVSISFGIHRLGHAIKTSCIKFQTVDREIC